MCPVSGTELEEPDFKDMPGCVPSPPWASAVRASVFAQTDVQDKPKRQTFRSYHPDLSPGFQVLACTSGKGKAMQSSPGHVTYLSHFRRLLPCVDGQSRTETPLMLIKNCFCSFNKLYSAFNPRQPTEPEEQGRRAGRWNPDEATKVAEFLGEKSLMKDSFEGSAALRLVSGFMRRHSAVSLCCLGIRNWLLLKILIEH